MPVTSRYELERSSRDVTEVQRRFLYVGTERNDEKRKSNYTVSQAWEWANPYTTPEHGNAFVRSGVSKACFSFCLAYSQDDRQLFPVFPSCFPFSIAHFYSSFTFFNKVCCVLLLWLNFNLCKKFLPLFRLCSYLAIFLNLFYLFLRLSCSHFQGSSSNSSNTKHNHSAVTTWNKRARLV
jgi:hypothetical protein